MACCGCSQFTGTLLTFSRLMSCCGCVAGVFFCETPLPLDDLQAIGYLAANSPVPIAFGEMQSHHAEFVDLFDIGGIQVRIDTAFRLRVHCCSSLRHCLSLAIPLLFFAKTLPFACDPTAVLR